MDKLIVHHEPAWLFQCFKKYEKCVFCGDDTPYWVKIPNKPCCKECAETNTIETLHAKLKELKSKDK